MTIRFETKGWCDVAVAVEDASRKILGHLACGVPGPNAPEPFQENTKRQTIVWDGKDDQGAYIDDKDSVSVRVSLGLEALRAYLLAGCAAELPAGSPTSAL